MTDFLEADLPDTMRVAMAAEHALLGDITVMSAPRPQAPAPGEVLIRVAAAGVNPVDVKSRQGRGAAAFLVPAGDAASAFPWVPGWDVAGRVVETGRGVARFDVGNRVFGTVNFPRSANGYAEFVVAPVAHLCETPDRLSDIEAAALPMAGLTAWQSLVYAGGLKSGQRVLITAAAGGVGHLAVQIACDRGAQVIALASPANLDFVAGLGAHQTIDRTCRQWASKVADVDVVLDMFGGNASGLDDLYALLKPGGRLVTVSSAPLQHSPVGITARMVIVTTDGHCLHQLADAARRGTVIPHVSTVLPLESAGRAHELMEAGRTRGKIVLDIASPR